ncbi:DUF6081 family protein [Streptomyces albireticuli]|uniref:DUF6081 family protein n=1 Tax=Streptomyces albireticuli TaxID=1940 RepID=UPI00117EB26F|nr:DUF6081 family protein [Streptomyces albireticuli]MCD9141280.1 DUF6081 family protein [Streptomyces albireticuli]MCD9160759.1 DUF6081 family protein [Streptomyces albireticuli]MCD9191184.1 DUF6081 family protein [Streptomyces albireticuli]
MSHGAAEKVIWDADFAGGFTATGPDARWWHYAQQSYVGDDGRVTTSDQGLRVVSGGVNPVTGEPAFVRGLGQDHVNGAGLPGEIDHVKWLSYANERAAGGMPGFDAVRGQVLHFDTVFSGRTYGTAAHPFGEAVADPDSDLRLASAAAPIVDFESFIGVEFFLTNAKVYACYERLPFGRGQLGDYAAFLYAVPVADRAPGDVHHCRVSYDRAAGTVRYLLEGEEVFRVDRLGYRLAGREHLMLEHGGEDTPAEPRQFAAGIGLFTVLDGALTGHANASGLVRLTPRPEQYHSTLQGPPVPQTFVDPDSAETSRLFGQGAEVTVASYTVSVSEAAGG